MLDFLGVIGSDVWTWARRGVPAVHVHGLKPVLLTSSVRSSVLRTSPEAVSRKHLAHTALI